MDLQKPFGPRVFAGAVAAYSIAWATVWLQPVMVADLLAYAGVTKSAAGFFVTVEMVAVSLSAAACSRLVKGAPFLNVALAGVLLAIVGNVLSWVLLGQHALLLAARVLCGLGQGAVLMVSSMVLARFAEPERAYARVALVANLMASTLVYFAPAWVAVAGGPRAFPLLIGFFALLLPLLFALPARQSGAAPATAKTDRGASEQRLPVPWRTIAMIWAAYFSYVVVSGALWSFSFVIGLQTGLSAEAVTRTIAISIFLSLVGSFLASITGSRFGRRLPFAVGLTLVEGSLFFLTHTREALVFQVCLALLMVGGYFVTPYFSGYAAVQDRTGRGAALVGSAAPLGFAMGPYLGGLLLEQAHGTPVLGWLGVLAGCLAFTLIWLVERTRQSLTPAVA